MPYSAKMQVKSVSQNIRRVQIRMRFKQPDSRQILCLTIYDGASYIPERYEKSISDLELPLKGLKLNLLIFL
jgi:hypothetical protein